MAAFLWAAGGQRLYPALHLAAHTGMRRGEIVGLKWVDLDRSTRRVSVRRTVQSLAGRHGVQALTQKDIDAAVLRTLQTQSLPSAAARAAEIIRPSVVRVVGYGTEKTTPEAKTEKRGRNMAKGKPPEATDEVPGKQVERGVGTGVVIVDKGIILTNLHVVAGAETVKVTFADGLEAPAIVTGVQPENDLAVLQAQKLPDDLIPATMRSSFAGTCRAWIGEPKVVRRPSVSLRSLMPTGSPWSGPSLSPRSTACSARFASSRARYRGCGDGVERRVDLRDALEAAREQLDRRDGLGADQPAQRDGAEVAELGHGCLSWI